MVNFNDLSPEDKERLLAQAREEVEKENIAKNATAMYAMKKKEHVDYLVANLATTLKLKNGPAVSKCRDRFVHMTNYLYSLNMPTVRHGNSVAKITTAEDWDLFQNICKNVHECMVHSVKYTNIIK